LEANVAATIVVVTSAAAPFAYSTSSFVRAS